MTELHSYSNIQGSVNERRLKSVLASFILITVLVVVKLLVTASSYQQTRTALRQHASATDTLLIPGLRGTLLDHAQQRMAKSVRVLQVLKETAPATHEDQGNSSLQKPEPTQRPSLQQPASQLRYHFKRTLLPIATGNTSPKHNTRPSTSDFGATAIDPDTGLEIGTNGLELQWDKQLRGTLVQCKLLQDRRRVVLSTSTPHGQSVHLHRTSLP